MRGETSIQSTARLRREFAPALRDAGLEAGKVADELFTFGEALDGSAGLQSALTDPSISDKDKLRLVFAIAGDSLSDLTKDILARIVHCRWSLSRHIASALEDLAVDAVLYQADAQGVKGRKIAAQLSQLRSVLLNMPELRSALSDEYSTWENRVHLLQTVLKDSGIQPTAMELAVRATRNLRNRRFISTLQWLIERICEHSGEMVVTVTTATPLHDEQIERLAGIYEKKLDRPVHLTMVVDSSVIGGMRIQYGASVIDNTVAAQLRGLKKKIVLK